jgi:acid phosphatase family membrane protein YuiD
MIEFIAYNKVFFAVIIAAVLSQAAKIAFNLIYEKRSLSLADFIVTGGMPSTHSAVVSSLFSILLLLEGLSTATVIAFVIFTIVITDSMGVRRTAGEEGKAINKIIKVEHLKLKQVDYALGHRPSEVLAGITIGVFIALCVRFLI